MSETVTVATPDSAALTGSAQRKFEAANSLVIDSPAMYQIAADDLAAVKRHMKDLDEQRTSLVAPLNAVVTRINTMFKGPREFLEGAERSLKTRMLDYQTAEERKRREEEARARAEAGKKAAELRARIGAQLRADEERARIETERLEAERQAALADGNTVAAAKLESKLEKVAEVSAIKQDAAAEQIALVQAAPVAVAVETKVSGISTRTNWKATVTDMATFLSCVSANPQYLNLVKVDEKALNQMAKALKSNLNIPGVKVEEERILASRAA